MTWRKLTQLFLALALPQIVGGLGSLFSAPAVPAWYAGLQKSSLTPPSWVFGPVWVSLFFLMGLAAFLLWQKGWRQKGVPLALGLFLLQLGLNLLWSFLFFGQQSPGWALLEIGLLWLAILATLWAFHKVSRVAAWLLLPYLLWVSFAAYLNWQIWFLNS